VAGLDNIPERGPFLLVCNHQSELDPILIQSVIGRPVHTIAKSTLFGVPFVGWLLRRIYAFPVRRYQVDPQAVRVALRRLSQNCGVAIYIEGERSWDGELQEPRPGTIRLALKAGVPVIPCVIQGSYEASPRWDGRIRPGRVSIAVLPPIAFPRLDGRRNREPALQDAQRTIMNALAGEIGRLRGLN
jgi:1-acyl-sn-glycerol-3-phosphate acyltransferase